MGAPIFLERMAGCVNLGREEPARAAVQSGFQVAMLVATGETFVTLTDARNPSAASAASS